MGNRVPDLDRNPLPPVGAWVEQAACAGHDPELWEPDHYDAKSTAVPKRICRGCPVREQCLVDALAVPADRDKTGVRAATTPRERARIRRELAMRKAARAACGTPRGYRAHRVRGEQACPDCRAVRAAYSRRYRADLTAAAQAATRPRATSTEIIAQHRAAEGADL